MNLTEILRERLPTETVSLLREIGKLAFQRGMTAYAVGGFVRDLLLGTPTLDIDIVVEGNGIVFAEELAQLWQADLTIHERFLTATLRWQQPSTCLPVSPSIPKPFCTFTLSRLDIATARRERYLQPAALPEVEPANIPEDLHRRDFSINAMAICIAPDRFGELVDPTGGFLDLQKGIIRVLHEKSFIDDPTRIFRAVRYEQRFGFKIERKTLKLICQARDKSILTKLTRDRIKHELWRILQERNPVKPLRRLKQLGILALVAPEIRITPRRLEWMERTGKWIKWFTESLPNEKLDCEWTLLLPLLPSEEAIASFCQRYQLGERERKIGIALLKGMKRRTPKRPSSWVKWLNPLPIEVALALAANRALVTDENWQRYFLKLRWVRPDISGDDLKAHGISGRTIDLGLQAALEAKLDKSANAFEQLKVALKRARQTNSSRG